MRFFLFMIVVSGMIFWYWDEGREKVLMLGSSLDTLFEEKSRFAGADDSNKSAVLGVQTLEPVVAES